MENLATLTTSITEKRNEINECSEVEAKKIKLDDDCQDHQPKVEVSDEAKAKLVKKRKYALCVGYSGHGYYGLQRNPTNKEFRTIEDEIVDGLVKINCIPQVHADEMFKMSFQRAARTDKGVSAAANLISLKMELDDDSLTKLNDTIPKQIKVFGYRKVTQGFDAKNSCDARTYMYILPTFAFCPIDEITTEAYRAPDSVIDNVNEIFKLYLGTHNYHNFTKGKYSSLPKTRTLLFFIFYLAKKGH